MLLSIFKNTYKSCMLLRLNQILFKNFLSCIQISFCLFNISLSENYIIILVKIPEMSQQEFFSNNQNQPVLGFYGLITPEKKIKISVFPTPNSKHGAFAKVKIDETPKNSFLSKINASNLEYQNSPIRTPLIPFKSFGSVSHRPLAESQNFKSLQNFEESSSQPQHHYMINFEPQQSDTRDKSKCAYRKNKSVAQCSMEQQYESISEQFILKNSSTHKMKRTHEKGLKNLSQMVVDIVQELGLSTYKEVTDKLMNELFEQGVSSKNTKDQTNIKRRAYDILNVLVSSQQLQKVGKKIGPIRKTNFKNQTEQIKLLRRQIEMKKKSIFKKQGQLLKMKQKLLLEKDRSIYQQDQKARQFSLQKFEFQTISKNNKESL